MTPKEILIGARDYLSDPKNWTQGNFEDDNGAVCSLGALRRISPLESTWRAVKFDNYEYQIRFHSENIEHLRAIQYLVDVIDNQLPGCIVIPTWNDNPDRTHDDVLLAFGKAIAVAEAEEILAGVQLFTTPSDTDAENNDPDTRTVAADRVYGYV